MCHQLLNQYVSQFALVLNKAEEKELDVSLGMYAPSTNNIDGVCVTSGIECWD